MFISLVCKQCLLLQSSAALWCLFLLNVTFFKSGGTLGELMGLEEPWFYPWPGICLPLLLTPLLTGPQEKVEGTFSLTADYVTM